MKTLEALLKMTITHTFELLLRGEISQELYEDLIHDLWEMLTVIRGQS